MSRSTPNQSTYVGLVRILSGLPAQGGLDALDPLDFAAFVLCGGGGGGGGRGEKKMLKLEANHLSRYHVMSASSLLILTPILRGLREALKRNEPKSEKYVFVWFVTATVRAVCCGMERYGRIRENASTIEGGLYIFDPS